VKKHLSWYKSTNLSLCFSFCWRYGQHECNVCTPKIGTRVLIWLRSGNMLKCLYSYTFTLLWL